MRALLQRVSQAAVEVDGSLVAGIGPGLLALVAAGTGDGEAEADRLAAKIARLRVFADDEGRMNRSVGEVGGSVLCVSQFTLYADLRRGNRPGFTAAAVPELAEPLVERVAAGLEQQGVRVARGSFGAHMRVSLVNDGPVTIWMDTAEWGGAAGSDPAGV
jgi:D-aminoacyl-tRNA deacylase